MADFQWWLLLVGLVAGGGLVAVLSMDGKRREQDLDDLERTAEANWIAERLTDSARELDGPTVESVLRLHRDYLGLPPPDVLLDRAPDGIADDVGDDRGGAADEDLAAAREQEAAAREEADARADGEEGGER
jgi:hypothetical protein